MVPQPTTIPRAPTDNIKTRKTAVEHFKLITNYYQFIVFVFLNSSWDISIDIVKGYELEGRGSISGGAKILFCTP
jgi:hypothetical protein